MEQHDDTTEKLPPIDVLIVRGKEDICVKVTYIIKRKNIIFCQNHKYTVKSYNEHS